MAASERIRVLQAHLLPQTGALTPVFTAAKNFKFTYKGDVLREDQRLFYENNGYLLVKNLVPAEEIEKYRQRFLDICDRKVDVPGLLVMKDVTMVKQGITVTNEMVINKIQDFINDDVLWHYCKTPQVIRYVEDFIGPNIMGMHTMLINKPPDPGTKTSRHPMHQDLHYFPFRPSERIVCAWTAMQKIDRTNGCLVVVPGSHKGELQPHTYPDWEGGVNKMYHGIQDYDPSQPRVHLEMEKGDCVFFHPVLIHGSGANRTEGCRKSISCHYAASECHFIDVEGTTQQNIADEVKEIAKRKTGFDVSFQDTWRFRSRLVIGQQINL